MDVSVIIPTLNEAREIAGAIDHTRQTGACEIVVVDGGSTDDTLALASAADVRLTAERGRANQQNAGAAASGGDVLLFLHADCRLGAGSFDAIRQALAEPRVAGGCFRQRIDASGARFRYLEWGNALRVKTLQWAYGDQGIFLRRADFERIGGFPAVPLMEDLLLMKRIKRIGRVALLEPRIHVSARRWQKKGVLRQTVQNWMMIGLTQCGVSPDRLARFYEHVR